jgi:translation initiation factor 1A
MPNKKGGKKFKRGKKDAFENRKLILKDPKEDQEYAQVKKVNGSGRYQLFCFDGTDRLGIAAGNIKKKTRLTLYDVVLVSLWDFQDTKCSIIHKYEEDEVQKLKSQKEFPENIKLAGEPTTDDFFEESIQFDYGLPEEEKEKENSSSSDEEEEEEEEELIDLDDI